MTDRYERIRAALAMGPTPVSWAQDIDEDIAYAMFSCRSAAEAAFITACDPDTIRSLLEERDALADALEAVQMGLRYATHAWVSDEIERSEALKDANDEVASHDHDTLYRLKSGFSLAYWRGALESAFEECAQIERALGLPEGHTSIYKRLKQFERLIDSLEEVRDEY